MSAPSILFDPEAMATIIPPCPTCGQRPQPDCVDPPVELIEPCPVCGVLATVIHPQDDGPAEEPDEESEADRALARAAAALPPDDHPLCASTMAPSVAAAQEQGPGLDPRRHPLVVVRQLVEEPLDPWRADHLERDERWQQAAASARALRWDDADPRRDEQDPSFRAFLRSIPLQRYQDVQLGQALQWSGWPNTARCRARLRATLERVPRSQYPPLRRLFLVTSIAYGQRQPDGSWAYDARPEPVVQGAFGWPLTDKMLALAGPVLAMQRRKLEHWFAERMVPGTVLGPPSGRRRQPWEYLASELVKEHVKTVAGKYRSYDGDWGARGRRAARLAR
jgi:hypothetical protein